jgi:hypothetical protein
MHGWRKNLKGGGSSPCEWAGAFRQGPEQKDPDELARWTSLKKPKTHARLLRLKPAYV